MLQLSTDHSTGKESTGELQLSGSMTRQQEQEFNAADDKSHLANMGRMIEEMENRMRDSLQDVYFGKTKSTVNKLYKAQGAAMDVQKDAMAAAPERLDRMINEERAQAKVGAVGSNPSRTV